MPFIPTYPLCVLALHPYLSPPSSPSSPSTASTTRSISSIAWPLAPSHLPFSPPTSAHTSTLHSSTTSISASRFTSPQSKWRTLTPPLSLHVFTGILLSVVTEIHNTRWFWRHSKTPLQWLLGTRPSWYVFFWSYIYYLSHFLHMFRTLFTIARSIWSLGWSIWPWRCSMKCQRIILCLITRSLNFVMVDNDTNF